MEKQNNIVTGPSEDMHDIVIGVKIKGETKEFTFIANIGESDIDAVFHNWIMRTKEYTTQSLVDYINSKSAHGFYAEVKE